MKVFTQKAMGIDLSNFDRIYVEATSFSNESYSICAKETNERTRKTEGKYFAEPEIIKLGEYRKKEKAESICLDITKQWASGESFFEMPQDQDLPD